MPAHLTQLAVIAGAFALAWLCSRASPRLAERIVRRHERSQTGIEPTTQILAGIKRHATTVSLVQTSVRYSAYLVATVVAFLQLAGHTGTATIAGASILVLLIGFALQRFLIDVLSGGFMLFEGWFDVGDSISLEPWGIAGVVDEVSLRSTKLRTVGGDVIRINNSTIIATRVMPRGLRRVSLELFVTEPERGRELVESAARMMPTGPTHFTAAPRVERIDALDERLHHITMRASVAPGREWLAYEFLPSVIKERDDDGLILHGPVVMEVDRQADLRYAWSRGLPLERDDEPSAPRPGGRNRSFPMRRRRVRRGHDR